MIHVSGGGGGGASHAMELGYAAITADADIASAATPQDVPGLSIACTVPAGSKYAVEFYAYAVDEDSGTVANEQIEVYLFNDANEVTRGDVYQITGGIGNALFVRSSTLTGDGSSHTYKVMVRNGTNGAHGVIISALDTSPAYIRVVTL